VTAASIHDGFTTPAMSAIFSVETRAQRMLDFEAALAIAEARAGVIPPDAADAIAAKCRVELFDIAALERDARSAGTPAIPLVKALTDLVDAGSRGYVHWGATSQDVVDTAMMLQVRDALGELIEGLRALGYVCAVKAERHRLTLMPGRTLLQHALPITFGLKAAHWLELTTRAIVRLREAGRRELALQFGGAAGTLAALGDRGPDVTSALAVELKLPAADLPWHTDRDRIAELAAAAAIVSGSMAKIANDVILLAQTEIGEVSEGRAAGKGGSSAMPHKRNPVDAVAAVAAARLTLGAVPVVFSAMAQEHERAAGGWQAEWVAIPDAFLFAAGAIQGVRSAVGSLEVDADRMRANLDSTQGLIAAEALTIALAPKLGRHEAYSLVEEASELAVQTDRDLRSVVAADDTVRTVLGDEDLDRIFDPANYLGSSDAFIDAALDHFRREVRARWETR
jgi:3-carboxy-cis,cis-muconate cycloisomerase